MTILIYSNCKQLLFANCSGCDQLVNLVKTHMSCQVLPLYNKSIAQAPTMTPAAGNTGICFSFLVHRFD